MILLLLFIIIFICIAINDIISLKQPRLFKYAVTGTQFYNKENYQKLVILFATFVYLDIFFKSSTSGCHLSFT